MPGIEQETESAAQQRNQQNEEKESSKNIVSLISQFADDNLIFLRNISTGLAIVGVIVIARSIKLITKFGAVSEIPARFIEKNVSLRGRVHSVTGKGLEVEHIPIYLPIISPLFTKRMKVSPLTVHLAGIELTPEGWLWLKTHLPPAQTVWLKPISREENVLHCLVSHSKRAIWSRCINEEALRLGLARTAPICGLSHNSRLFWNLHKQLLKAEGKAEKKGQGLWKEDSQWNRVVKAVRASSLYRVIKKLFKRT